MLMFLLLRCVNWWWLCNLTGNASVVPSDIRREVTKLTDAAEWGLWGIIAPEDGMSLGTLQHPASSSCGAQQIKGAPDHQGSPQARLGP